MVPLAGDAMAGMRTLVLTMAVCGVAGPSLAATTDWLSVRQVEGIVKGWGGAMYKTAPSQYATAIDCKDDGKGPRFRLTYMPLSDPKPFHRWNWVFSKSSDLARQVSRLKRSDRKELKYRVVQKRSYVSPEGVEMTCAIVYR